VGEILLRKLLACRDRIGRVRAALPAEPREILTDERLEAFISFNLFLLVQDAVDLAAHLIAEQGLGVPDSHRGAFEILAAKGLLSHEVAEGMGAMSSLRNRIAHAYGDLDPVRMVREAPAGLEIVACFIDELSARA
jgi:uncharacterized protein YutE (UPF0331/DUF86 family)